MKLPAFAARMSRRSQVIAAAGALALVGACAVIVTMGVGSAESVPLAGVPVPAKDVPLLVDAARSCPVLTPARLAGQVMEVSRFVADAKTAGGGQGIAGFTEEAWRTWAPWTGAARTDPQASILGLAHRVCDLVGQLRVAGVVGDPWLLSLAAYHSGADAVQAANAVPDDAITYVDTVAGYAAWYAQQPELGSSAPAVTSASDPVPVPDAYLPSVLSAGKVCAAISPSRVAAHLMALSGFNARLLADTGAQGIAQFTPDLWTAYAGSAKASPWDPSAAIPALGRAMCDLTKQLAGVPGDPYHLAIAAYGWGTAVVTSAGGEPTAEPIQTFIRQVALFADYYGRDPRLGGTPQSAGPTPTTQPTQPSTPPPPVRTTQPAPPRTTAPPPPPPPPPPGPVYTGLGYVGSASGKCLSAVKAADGTHSQIATCDGALTQQWSPQSDGTIRSVGLCMDAANGATTDGTPVQVAICSGNPAQQFAFQSNGQLFSSYANKCVDITAGATNDGALVILRPCTGVGSQKWIRK
jgi:hypothetical protein